MLNKTQNSFMKYIARTVPTFKIYVNLFFTNSLIPYITTT